MKKNVIIYVDNSTPISQNNKLNCMQSICFKPMIEYVLEAACIHSESNPYILTKNVDFINIAEKFNHY